MTAGTSGDWAWATRARSLADVAPLRADLTAPPPDGEAAVRLAGALVERDPVRARELAAASGGPGDVPRRARLVEARALAALGRAADALAAVRDLQAAQAADGGGPAPLLDWAAGEALAYLGALDEAAARFTEALGRFGEAGDAVGTARARLGLAKVHWAREDHVGALAEARLALDTLEAAGDPDAPGRAHALNLQGLALWQHGRPDEALEVLMTAERLAREHGCLVPAGLAVVNRALLLIDLGRDEDAGRLLAASLDGPLAANPRALSGIEHAQGRLCLRREDLPAAERHLRAAIATADDADLPAFALTARQDLAACVEAQGRLGEALGLLREAHAAERAIMGEHGEQRLWAIRMQRDLLAARAAEERLAREREALEARVAERTRELSGALEALRDEMAIRETVQERLRHLARHDGLTGLPNRDAMRREVALALARADPAGGRVAALLVDLDGFKHVNDTMGHGVGDRVLRAAAGRLDEAVPDGAVVGRVGGDEFLVVVPACPGRAAAAELAGRLRAALDPPLEAGDLRFHIRATVGVAISPEDGDDEEALLRAADLAMYAGKAGGRGRWAFHAAGMGDASRRRMALQGALPGAAGRDELEAVFQPRVRLADGRVAAVEALARWHHPALGAVAPGEFIAVCEDTGEIREVGAWMLGRALETAAALAAAGHDDVGVSVNVSPLQLATADFPAAVRDALARAGVAPRRLELEVTESAALDPGGLAAATLTETRATGVRVALDDFGSGYSNLAHLARLPVDRVKLDAGLVRDLERRRDARAIAAAVVALAGEIGLGVTAEGVERSGQLDLLRAMGCDEGQGFLFSAAVPAGAVLAAVAHGAA